MCGIKIPHQNFALKRQGGGGGLCARGGGIFAGHYSIIEKQEREKKNQLLRYKQCYTYKNRSLEVSKYMNPALVTYNKLDPRG